MLAKCYKLAAVAYSMGRCFLKFFDVCTAANLFDTGLQGICSWRKYDNVDLIKKCKHIKEAWHLFLWKGALHYHQLQNFGSMMRFVESFDSIDEKYLFLGTLGLSENKMLQEEELTISENEGFHSPGLHLQPKLVSVSVHKETSQNDTKTKGKMKVANNISTAKGSSRGSKFQPKLKSVWKETTFQNDTKSKERMKVADDMFSLGLQFQSKLEFKTVAQIDTTIRGKMKVAENMSTTKGSSQGLKFQSKIKSVWKETTSQYNTMTKEVELADNLSTAEEPLQGLQFQCKLEFETISQNDTTTRDSMEVSEDMSIVNGSSKELKFQPKLKSIWKETQSRNGTKTTDKMKLANSISMSIANESSQGLQFKSKLKTKTVSKNDTEKKDKIQVAEIMSTSEWSSHGLQFQSNQESLCMEKTSQNDSKIEDNLTVAPFISSPKDTSYKLQFKPKSVYAKEVIAAQNDLKMEKDEVNIVNKAEASQRLQQQCNQKVRNAHKETTSSIDSKAKKDKMKNSVNLSEFGDSSQQLQQLQIEQKKLKNKNVDGEKGKQKVTDHKFIAKQYWRKVTENGMKFNFQK